MGKSSVTCGFLAAAVFAATPAAAARSNCGPDGPPCGTAGRAKDSQVVPNPDQFSARGDLFSNTFTDLTLVNGSAPVNLGFSVNFGFGPVSTLFVNKNGIVSFGAPLSPSAVPTIGGRSALAAGTFGLDSGGDTRLSDLGLPVIAPYFGGLTLGSGAGDGDLDLGDIVVQYGQADPYADGGAYRREDLRSAVRITWYGLDASNTATAAAARATSSLVFAQLLISADDRGLSNFEFRYGSPNLELPYQADYGSIAGFALGDTQVQFKGPYQQGVPTFFEFLDGKYIGQFGERIDAAVPEPATWAQLILGFGMLGYTLRRRRARVTVAA